MVGFQDTVSISLWISWNFSFQFMPSPWFSELLCFSDLPTLSFGLLLYYFLLLPSACLFSIHCDLLDVSRSFLKFCPLWVCELAAWWAASSLQTCLICSGGAGSHSDLKKNSWISSANIEHWAFHVNIWISRVFRTVYNIGQLAGKLSGGSTF